MDFARRGEVENINATKVSLKEASRFLCRNEVEVDAKIRKLGLLGRSGRVPKPRLCLTMWVEASFNPRFVAHQAAPVGLTLDTYSHVIPGMQEDAVARIDAAFAGAVQQGERIGSKAVAKSRPRSK